MEDFEFKIVVEYSNSNIKKKSLFSYLFFSFFSSFKFQFRVMYNYRRTILDFLQHKLDDGSSELQKSFCFYLK